jgi:hypothetical protein
MLWQRLGHRQPAQIALIMPIAVLACIGILGLVLDIGIFRVIDSEFENAADAAALAAAWYDPVCPSIDRPGLPADPRCLTNPDGTLRTDNTRDSASTIASRVASANLGLASRLCADTPVVNPQIHSIQSPNAQALSVIVSCHAPYLAGAAIQVNSGSSQITRWATAALGSVQLDGTYAYISNQDPLDFPLLTSLVPL